MNKMKFAGIAVRDFATTRQGNDSGALVEVFRSLGIPVIEFPAGKTSDFLPELYKISEGFDALVIGHTDSDFYNLAENKKLLASFERHDSDYGFGDNYPPGILLEVLRREVLPVMENVRAASALPVRRQIFQDIMEKDVNMFDLENQYAEVSLRTLRLSFFPDSVQNADTLQKLRSLLPPGTNPISVDFKTFAENILKNRHLLKTIPKYYEIEISNTCGQKCVFCPKTSLPEAAPKSMAPVDFAKIIDAAKKFSTDPVISLTGMGDALSHPDFFSILDVALERNLEIIIETSGVGLTREHSDRLLALKGAEKLSLIFSIDAVKPELYASFRPGGDFEKILEEIEYLLLRRQKNTWVQIVKMNENFEHLVAYHNFFKKYTSNIIIQKYNRYRGKLPERRLNPMEPFEKIDCWHLKREVVVDVEGRVLVCKQDLGKEHVLGNLLRDSMETIYERGLPFLEKHIRGWDFCSGCDEYYTYNF